MMRFDLTLYLVTGVFLILLVLLTHWRWRCSRTAPATPKPTRRKREPKPFAGYTHKPECELCDQRTDSPPRSPTAPPPRMMFTRGRRRQVDTTGQCCPQATCSYHGWVDWGNIRANGQPNGHRWRQLVCLSCHRHFLEIHGTLFHAKQVDPDKLVWAITALAEGVGIRAVARIFETDPNTVLSWLVEAAEQFEAFSHYHLLDVYAEHIQMDELFALLSAVKEGEVSEAQAIKRLSRSPYWVWVAIDPVSKLIVAWDVGPRTQAMAQRLVHQVTQVLAPECAPLFLTDGFREYLIALVTHYGQWIQPERRQPKGQGLRRAGCPSPPCFMHRWSSPLGVGVSSESNTVSSSARPRPLSRFWPSEVGRSTRASSNA